MVDSIIAENFDDLTPEVILTTVEEELAVSLNNIVLPLPSYINRVYELETTSKERLIAKFYRPGRWSRGALLEEHLYMLDCVEAELPVVGPLRFPDGGTLRATESGIYFALYPKRGGRPIEMNKLEDWSRLGSLLGRLHLVGEMRKSRFRLKMCPEETTFNELENLMNSDLIGAMVYNEFEDSANELYNTIVENFCGENLIRVHGDCHCGNILSREEEGLVMIDFDDMMVGPPAQDIWLLLSGYVNDCQSEIKSLLKGYRQFRDFKPQEIKQLELLRGMRMIYYLDWCGRQSDDYNFKDRFPGWGEDLFWRRESATLRNQVNIIKQSFN